MVSLKVLALLGLATLTQAKRPPNEATACQNLMTKIPKSIPGTSVYVAQTYPNGTDFTEGNLAYPGPAPDLIAFCRVGVNITTSPQSLVQFEIWMPTGGQWNERLAVVGNGADAGGININDMAVPLSKYKFAVASTNTGHNGTGLDGTFAINNPQSQIDFGYRAVHLTTVYSKAIVKMFYGQSQKYSYWLGCSSGGKQGLKEVQMYPEDYDGVVAGAAAQWWSHLNGYTYHVQTYNPPGPDHLTPGLYGLVAQEVLKQCDGLDGLVDGMVNNPYVCHPNLATLACQGANPDTTKCLNPTQIKNMYAIWADWISKEGKNLFPGFSVMAEIFPYFSVSGTAFEPAPDYFRYQVLNETTVGPLNVDESTLEKLVAIADKTNPGGTTAWDGNIEPFFKRGGRLITYVGMADWLIPTGSTLRYRDLVLQTLKYDPSDHYKTFSISGMGHCSGGYAPYNFGGPGQAPLSLGGAGQAVENNPTYDMTLAIMQWVEKGKAPDYLIGGYYTNDDRSQGLNFTRKICAWPQTARYRYGDPNKASSFECYSGPQSFTAKIPSL